jgi:hypothetical protein
MSFARGSGINKKRVSNKRKSVRTSVSRSRSLQALATELSRKQGVKVKVQKGK